MKIGLATRPTAIFGAMSLAALIVLMPMRLALAIFGFGDAGLSARQVSGPVWFARLSETHFGDLDLGDVRAALSPFDLLIGRARVDLRGIGQTAGAGEDKPIAGAITISRHRFGLDDLTASVPVGTIFSPLPVSQVALEGVSVRFDDGACAAAQGRVRAVLSGGIAGIPLSQGLSGTVKCAGGALLIPLASQAGSESIRLHIRGNGRYRAELIVQSGDPQVTQALAQAGFQQGPSGYTLSVEGQF